MRYTVLFLFACTSIYAQINVDSLEKMANKELEILKSQIEENRISNEISNNEKKETVFDIVDLDQKSYNTDKDIYFGYNFLENDINFFNNIPTPSDYKLGPGDEILISIWGDTNLRETFVINKEGLIYYEDFGFINLSNKTIDEAETLLTIELSSVHSTLNNNSKSSKLMVELLKLKSLNIFFAGEVKKPGINLIHPFSDPLSAIAQAGGIDRNGSLRLIKIIRNNVVVAEIDFYNFFINGRNEFSDFKLIDGDIIHVPIVKTRASINGAVKRPLSYELLDSESLEDLINFSGGLSSTASGKAILRQSIPLNERIVEDLTSDVKSVDLLNADQININDGATIEVLPIYQNDSDVQIYGRVFRPGIYPLKKNIYNSDDGKLIEVSTLKDVLDIAGGFQDESYRKSILDEIIILRLDENQFYSKEFKIKYQESKNFELMVNDKIFVYENPNYKNDFTYDIVGEVNKPGTYPLLAGITLSDAISIAGGVTQLGSINNVTVSKKLLRLNESGNQVFDTELVANIDENFEVADGNIITILPKTNVIQVKGNVYNPGLIAHSGRSMSMAKAIELAGGYKPYSLKKRSYVIRANGEIEQANLFRGRAKRVFPGDSVFVPVDPNPNDFNITSFISDLSITLANIAAILILVDNQSD